jgi:hypothetical protein
VGRGVEVGVSLGRGVGSKVAVEEGDITGVGGAAGAFVPQAFNINKGINRNQ